jgi:hemerythrin-like metal-binding protein
MFFRTPHVAEADLPAHLDAIVAAIRAHFVREEAEMASVGVPILNCHKGQHAALLKEAETLSESFSRADARMRRHLIGFTLAQLVANHIASVDQISSAFFDAKIDYSDAGEEAKRGQATGKGDRE